MEIDPLLAQLPDPTAYFNPFKLAAIAVLFLGWVFAFQWVDRDADFVKTRRERWDLITLATGIGALAVLFLPPWAGSTFFIGVGFFVLIAAGGILTYIVHRNGRVVPDQRVLTLGHVRRVAARDDSGKTKVDRGQRIHLSDHDGEEVTRPSDRFEYERYALVQEFLFDVLWRRASDVELVVGKDAARLVYRIDGVATERNGLVQSVEEGEQTLACIKQLAGLNAEERRRPQEGAIYAAVLAAAGDLDRITVQTSGSTLGERLRLRIQQPTGKKKIGELGLAPPRLELTKKLIEHPKGLVLVSGPRGSGVTTTQYALVRCHDAFMRNIHALERKPLYDLDNITQVKHAETEGGVSYARQLQSVLRREPDIVAIGECDDRETAQIALRAAAQDRKIYMAIEAKSTIDAVSRLMSFAEDNQTVAKALVGVLNQRLIRILCTACRQSFKPDEALLKKANLPLDKIEHFHRPPTEPVFDRKGREIICQTCQGSGYVGRTAVIEVMIVESQMRQLIAAGASAKEIKAQARKNRLYYLQEEGLLKVIDGTTSLEEVIRGLREDSRDRERR